MICDTVPARYTEVNLNLLLSNVNLTETVNSPDEGTHLYSASTLFLAGVYPGAGNVGEILLREMTEFLSAGQLVGTAIVPANDFLREVQECEAPFPLQRLARRFEYAYRPLPGRAGAVVAWAARLATYERYLKGLIRQSVDWGRRHKTQRLWAVLDTPTVIEIAARVADKLQVPLYTLVWDAPEYLAQLRGLDTASGRRLMRRFRHALQRSTRTAVVSAAMKTTYEATYGTPCVIVRHGLDAALRRPAADGYTHDREFSIGVAGGLYCESAWRALLGALDHADWNIADKAIRLVVLGGEIRARTRGPMHLEYHGWRSVPETIEILAGCDLTYLPQPFENRLRDLARLSFPTKLSTYAAAGRPVLVHCPEYASLAPFTQQHRLGVTCTSLAPDRIIKAIAALANDRNAYCQAARVVGDLAATEFSQKHYRRQVEEFLA